MEILHCIPNCSVALIFGIIFLRSPSLARITFRLKCTCNRVVDQSLIDLWGKLMEFGWLYLLHLRDDRIYSLLLKKKKPHPFIEHLLCADYCTGTYLTQYTGLTSLCSTGVPLM